MNKTQKLLLIAVLAVILGCLILFGVALFGNISIGKVLDELTFYDSRDSLLLRYEMDHEQPTDESLVAEGQKLTNGVTEFDSDIICLELQDLFCELNITTGSSDALSVECHGLEQSLRSDAADGTLQLYGPSNQQISDITDLNKLFELLRKGVGTVNIILPRDWNGDIIINSFVGELNVKGAACRSLQADIYAAGVEITAFTCDDLQMKINAGELALDQVQLGELKAEVNVGSIELERLHADEISLSVDTGDVEFDAVEADALRSRVSVGNVEGTLSGAPTDYTIKASTDVGDCALPLSGSGPQMVDIEVSVGSIEIDFD